MDTLEKGIPFDKRLGYVLQQCFGLHNRKITRMVVTCVPGKPVVVTYDEAISAEHELGVSETIQTVVRQSKEQGNV